MDMKEEMMSDAVDDAMDAEGEEEEEVEGDRILKEVLDEIGISVGQQVSPAWSFRLFPGSPFLVARSLLAASAHRFFPCSLTLTLLRYGFSSLSPLLSLSSSAKPPPPSSNPCPTVPSPTPERPSQKD